MAYGLKACSCHPLNVYNMYNLELGVFMYKYSTDDLPTIFKDYFSKRSQIHNRDTRNMTNYNLRKNRTNFASKEWKHLDLFFWILYQKKLNCLSMSKHLESNWRTTYFLIIWGKTEQILHPRSENIWTCFLEFFTKRN